MKLDAGLQGRLDFLTRVVRKESRYLILTDERLFADLLEPAGLELVLQDAVLAERLDAFVSRLGRLQDTLADKLLPALLDASAEPRGAAIDNLDRAEKLGWLTSADQWLDMRKLRNQMVHEYIEDRVILMNALQAGHAFVPVLAQAAETLAFQVQQRLGRV